MRLPGKVGEAVSGNSETGKTFAIIGEKDKVQVVARFWSWILERFL